MANKARAEVEVVGASAKRYVLRFGSGAICQLEQVLDMDVMQMAESFQRGKVRFTTIREFVKAGLVDDLAKTDEVANEVIDDVGLMPLIKAITDSLLLTFNVASANPPKPERPRRVAGSGSSSEPQKLAS